MRDEKKVCSICNRKYRGFGNNAQPINNGRCCDACNDDVIQARYARFEQGLPMREASPHNFAEVFNGLMIDGLIAPNADGTFSLTAAGKMAAGELP
jgi:hypothetical protein